jgi:hypothetical protein
MPNATGPQPIRILHLEDDPNDADLVLEALRCGGLSTRIERLCRKQDYAEALERGGFDLILADNNLPGFDGLAALSMARAKRPEIPFIFVTGSMGEEVAVDAVRSGATDYVLKDRLARLPVSVRRALEESAERARRRQVEQALEHSEEKYRAVVANMPGVLWAGDEEGNTTFVTPNAESVTGFTAEEIVRQGATFWFSRIHEDDLSRVRSAFESLFRGSGQFDIEYRLRRKDDAWIWIHDRGVATFEEGGRRYAYGLYTDVTERKRLEEQFLQAQRMEGLGRLAGGIAHDFNNLLTVISGYTERVLEELPAESPVRPHVEEILAAGKRAAALTRQLLAFSRRQVFKPVPVDLNRILAGLHTMLERLVGDDVELVTAGAPNLWSVNADAGQIEQVVVNLVVNGRDAMPRGGRITIETANVQLDESYARSHLQAKAGPHVLLSVSDTGHGMSPEVRKHLFEPFFTTKEQGKGTGLGLSTVHGIVRQSGGHVEVYSEPNMGSVFKVYLPASSVAAAAEPASAPPAGGAPRGTETVLIAEDSDTVRRLAREILEAYGYTVLTARDGYEAFKICEDFAGPIHLLLADAVMPSVSGPELADFALALRPELKILYMSGYSEKIVEEPRLLGPGRAFLQKPFSVDSLVRKVRDVLDGRA